MGILICQYKDPYKPISIMECHKGFERCSSASPYLAGGERGTGSTGLSSQGISDGKISAPKNRVGSPFGGLGSFLISVGVKL